jgi:FdrA protein
LSIREERLEKEMADPEAAVILMDIVLGDGSHENPVGQMTEILSKAKRLNENKGYHLAFVASITGTDQDIQNIAEQKKMLVSQDCLVMPSNYQAGLVAGEIILAIERQRGLK